MLKRRKLQPDLVLMDILLPGKMDGVEATDRMRDCFDVPVVYLAAHTDARSRVEVLLGIFSSRSTKEN